MSVLTKAHLTINYGTHHIQAIILKIKSNETCYHNIPIILIYDIFANLESAKFLSNYRLKVILLADWDGRWDLLKGNLYLLSRNLVQSHALQTVSSPRRLLKSYKFCLGKSGRVCHGLIGWHHLILSVNRAAYPEHISAVFERLRKQKLKLHSRQG